MPSSPAAALSYIFCSICLVIFNKAVLTEYSFKAPVLLTACQQGIALSWSLAKDKFWSEKSVLPRITVRNVRSLVPVSVSFLSYLVLGMYGLAAVNVAMYGVLRRTSIVFVLAVEYLVEGKRATKPVLLSVVLMVGGAIVAGATDLEFDPYSYAILITYNAATALYLVLIKRAGRLRPDFTQSSLVFLNAVVVLPMMALWSWASGELDTVRDFAGWQDPRFNLMFLLSSTLGTVLNYTIFWNTSANSALTQSVSGQVKDIGVVAVGVLAFGNPMGGFVNVCAILLSFLGSFYYGYIKYLDKVAADKVARMKETV